MRQSRLPGAHLRSYPEPARTGSADAPRAAGAAPNQRERFFIVRIGKTRRDRRTLLFFERPALRMAMLLIPAVWCFCRFYYFAFYVMNATWIQIIASPGGKRHGIRIGPGCFSGNSLAERRALLSASRRLEEGTSSTVRRRRYRCWYPARARCRHSPPGPPRSIRG
jgi:hypothetical protein